MSLAIDLFCGLGGWTDGFLAEGWDVVGFDIQRHEYGESKYPAQLVLQDVLTIDGAQFRNADVIVASPPCQAYSYLAMPWSRSKDPENSKAAKALRKKWETEGPDNRMFDACFRIQEEAIAATRDICPDCDGCGQTGPERGCFACTGTGLGPARHIPLIVENVCGAVPWVGREKAKFGSFYLWGDVAQVGNRVFAGMDLTEIATGRGRFGMGVAPKSAESAQKFNPDGTDHPKGSWFRIANSSQGDRGQKVTTEGEGRRTDVGKGARFTSLDCGIEADGTTIGGDWFSDPNSTCRKHGSRSNARKAASAMIAKIPLSLSRYVARVHGVHVHGVHGGAQGGDCIMRDCRSEGDARPVTPNTWS